MPEPSLNYSFLLLIDMLCAGRKIQEEVVEALCGLAHQTRMNQPTFSEMKKFLFENSEYFLIGTTAQRFLEQERVEVIRRIITVTYLDSFYPPAESEFVEKIVTLCKTSCIKITRTKVKRLLEAAVNFAQQSLPHLDQHETLLEGVEYNRAIETCSRVAQEDYQFAKTVLNKTSQCLQTLEQNLLQTVEVVRNKAGCREKTTSAGEVAQQLEGTIESLTTEITHNLNKIDQSLESKQRALNQFTIAFMGKTKAGKSTLHAIVAGEGWDAIGVGKQRTTRENRVYTWNNIRIIDTPGIGAPGGQTDEEIAESVIDEADVICYVVTNDSIQESEFNFLQVLKEKTKPLLVLLNLKQNLRDAKRLEYFLQNPGKLFVMEGKSGIGGHIERICRYAQQHYANDYFSIIPVMLLAAQMSREPEHFNFQNELLKASRLQNFLDTIRQSIIDHGTIRRSQTLLGSTVSAIDEPHKWTIQQTQSFTRLIETLRAKRCTIQENIKKAQKDIAFSLEQQLKQIFRSIFDAVPSFAEEYWEANEINMRLGWELQLQSIRLEERLKIACQEAGNQFNEEVKAALEEIGKELQLIAQLTGGNFTFKRQDSFDERLLFRIGGGILIITAAVLAFTPFGLIGMVLGVLGSITSIVANFFKSRDRKRREAVQKISTALSNQLEKYQQTTLQNAEIGLNEHCHNVSMAVDQYFEELIRGLDEILTHLEKSEKQLYQSSNNLNRAYAKRILDWCVDRIETLCEVNIDRAIAWVEREFGRSMTIYVRTDLPLKKSQDEIKFILQENVIIHID